MKPKLGIPGFMVALALSASCSRTTDGSATSVGDEETAAGAPAAGGDKCLVVLHGKSGTGGETYVEDGVTKIFPTGNEEGWGGRQWMYFPDNRFEEARDIVINAAEGCGQVIIGGFSNGGAFAAKLYCTGETLDGRLTGVVIDDPVPDHGADDCDPGSNIDVTVYWTGALVEAEPGWKCVEADWTCEGGETIGLEAYTENIGAEAKPSKYTDHEWYYEAPELTAFR